MNWILYIIVGILLVNAIFWGLFPHKTHCDFISMLKIKCPPHYVHLIISILSFVLAVGIQQRAYLKSLIKK